MNFEKIEEFQESTQNSSDITTQSFLIRLFDLVKIRVCFSKVFYKFKFLSKEAVGTHYFFFVKL